MKKSRAAIAVCMASFTCMLVFAVYYVDLHGRYKTDRDYAFVCVEKDGYHDLKKEDYVKGTYLTEENQTAEAGSIHKKVDTTLVTVDFSPEDIFGAGAGFTQQDTEGCMLSSTLADRLFGDRNITGLLVTVKGKNYPVRTVFESEEVMMIVQRGHTGGGDWALMESRSISGVVLDVSEEMYRGQYAEEFSIRHNTEGSSYYYASDYLNILPGLEFPAKWSDFDIWSEWEEELHAISERRVYHNKDVVETFYYRIYNKLQGYRMLIAITAILFAVSVIKCISIYRKRKKV
ncbi:MAG: ABC transporter permease [Lachnospiraceae bacterium]